MAAELIYVADDEPSICDIIERFLKNDGYRVETFASGDALLRAFRAAPPDMVVLDIMMDGTDGLAACAQIREKSGIPIVLVSAKDSELDRVLGITMGADDYLVKPFSPIELVARVKGIFRRMQLDKEPGEAVTLVYGDLAINTAARSARLGEQTLDLTPLEFSLTSYLIAHADRAVSREELLRNVWRFEIEVDTRATDDLVKRLRRKLRESRVRIESVWGFGFKLALEERPKCNP